jgi:hypothetical protein
MFSKGQNSRAHCFPLQHELNGEQQLKFPVGRAQQKLSEAPLSVRRLLQNCVRRVFAFDTIATSQSNPEVPAGTESATSPDSAEAPGFRLHYQETK